MEEPLLRLADVNKNFGGVAALNGVSLDVGRGRIVGLIGPNGAGKTTVFNVITGAYAIDGGAILLEDRLIHGLEAYRIARLGIARTFQNIRLFSSMTVWEHLLCAGSHLHSPLRRLLPAGLNSRHFKEHAAEIMTLLGLAPYRERLAMTLAYGLQRKVEIARALMAQPKLLLVDEPAAGINPNEAEDLRSLFLELKRHGLTVLVIEHDMPFIMNLCDYLYVLDFGTVIAHGVPAAIRSNKAVLDAYLGYDA